MSRADEQLERLTEKWRTAVEEAKPAYDHERVRSKLVEGRVRPRRNGIRFQPILVAATFVAAAALIFGLTRHKPAPPPLVITTPGVEIGAWLAAGPAETRVVAFSDGSGVALLGDAQARVTSVEPHGARIVLERGTVSLTITADAAGSWRVVAGPYEVAVKGTVFTVNWEPTPSHERIDVAVTRGAVVMTGPLVEEGKRLEAGQSWSIEPTKQLVSARGDRENIAENEEVPAAPSPGAQQVSRPDPRPAAEPTPTWQDLEQAGKYAAAVQAAERQGLARILATAGSDELMDLARASRLSKRYDVAKRALLAERLRFAGSRQAARAAFLLGADSSAAEAADWFSIYLREQPAGGLAPEALGRLVESFDLSGNREGAQGAARNYLARYPNGPHAELARRVLRK